jgi:hypothetical protein
MSKIKEVLKAIDPKTVAEKIVTPCKIAEQLYKAKHLLPQNYQEFLEDCGAYWAHLTKHYHSTPNVSIPMEYAGGMALQYVDQAFRKYGGTRYAFEKSKELTFGYVKYGITEEFIREASLNYTGYMLRSMVNPYDYQELVSLMKEYVREFQIEVKSQGDFQVMIQNYSMILQSHVQHHAQMALERMTGHTV